jgi:hypothetical protein
LCVVGKNLLLKKHQGRDAPTTCVGEIKLIEYSQNMMHKKSKKIIVYTEGITGEKTGKWKEKITNIYDYISSCDGCTQNKIEIT